MGNGNRAPADTAPGITTGDGLLLEAVLTAADPTTTGASAPRAIAVVTHPHPLHGGDMGNPVPAGLARGLRAHGVTVLRFNFRGTGASEGRHGGGDPERLDVVAAVDVATGAAPGVPVIGVGYSFGADVLLGTTDDRLAGVVAVAPPLGVLPVHVLRAPRGPHPTLILSPEHDQFCDPDRANGVASDWPETTVEPIPGTDHFLAGRIDHVVDRVVAFLAAGPLT